MIIRNATIFIFFTFCLTFCYSNGEKQPDSNLLKCPYTELASYSHYTSTTGEGEINLNNKFSIYKNIQQLLNISDSFEINSGISKHVTNLKIDSVVYDKKFIQIHNSIIQILCAIEKDLSDTTLTFEDKKNIFNEKISKRSEYFQFLLNYSHDGLNDKKNKSKDENKSNSDISESNSILENKPLEKLSPIIPSNASHSFNILTSPLGASIYIDDNFMGTTNSQLKLGPGRHKIRLDLDGYQKTEDVILIPDQKVLSIQLNKTNK